MTKRRVYIFEFECDDCHVRARFTTTDKGFLPEGWWTTYWNDKVRDHFCPDCAKRLGIERR